MEVEVVALMMRRIVMLVTVGMVMAAMMVATAMPLFADPPPNEHNCGGLGSYGAPEYQNRGQPAQRTKPAALAGTQGEEVRAGTGAHANCGNNR